MNKLIAGLIGLTLAWTAAQAEQVFTIDTSHATIGFEVSHLVISKVRGDFDTFEGSLTLDDNNNLVGGQAVIKAKSIDTGVEKRDNHMRNEDFFDVETYPEITFKSTGVKEEDGKSVLVGDLTIRDVTREVSLPYAVLGPIKDPWGNTKIGFEASTVINRTDFGLTWNRALEAGGVVVGEEVKLMINLEAGL